MNIFLLTLFVLPAVVLLDLLWLGVIAKNFYQASLGHLLSSGVVWWAAIAFYALYAFGIAYFAVAPALAVRSLARAAILGAVLGMVAYGTYDLTNQATLRDWPAAMTALDIAWGAVISASAAAGAYLAASWAGF